MEIDLINAQGGPGGEYPINFYFESDTREGKPALIGTPGTYLLQDIGVALPVTAILHVKKDNQYGDTYATISTSVYKSTNGAAFSLLGYCCYPNTVPDFLSLDMCAGYLVSAGDKPDPSYGRVYYEESGGTMSYVNPGFIPSSIATVDGYVVASKINTRTLYHSDLLDPSTWSSLNTAALVNAGDSLCCVKNLNGELWAIGHQTTEVLYNQGGTGFQFAVLPQGFLNVGCLFPYTVVNMENSLYFLNERRQACRTVGYNFQVISPPRLSYTFSSLAQARDITDVRGFDIYVNGKPWYVLAFDNYTYVCDIEVLNAYGPDRAWFRWKTGTGGNHGAAGHIAYGASALTGSVTGSDYWIVGSDDGRLFKVHPGFYADETYSDDTPIESSMVSGSISQDRKPLIHHSLELDIYPTLGATPNATRTTTTTLSADADQGSLEIVVTSATDFDDEDVIVITLDDGTTFQTWQDGAAAGTTITLEEALPSAASSGDAVVSYNPTMEVADLEVGESYDATTYCPRVELFYRDERSSISGDGTAVEAAASWTSLGKRRMYTWPDNSNASRQFMKIVWYGLGISRDRYYKIQMDEACYKKIFSASLNVSLGE